MTLWLNDQIVRFRVIKLTYGYVTFRLTLICAAGGVHDFRNFEQVYSYNALSNEIFLN
jgi:hypothetical protein